MVFTNKDTVHMARDNTTHENNGKGENQRIKDIGYSKAKRDSLRRESYTSMNQHCHYKKLSILRPMCYDPCEKLPLFHICDSCHDD